MSIFHQAFTRACHRGRFRDAAFTLIELRKEFSIFESRFSNNQTIAAASLWSGSVQSKIGNPKSKIHHASRGFTLIELLTVIAIIGILAAILIPTVGAVRTSAKSSRCISNLRQIGVAAQAWGADNKDYIVPVYRPTQGKASTLVNWTGFLAPYVGRSADIPFSGPQDVSVYVCPETPMHFGYGYNNTFLSWEWVGNSRYRRTKYSEVAVSSQTILMIDQQTVAPESIDDNDWEAWVPYVRCPSQTQNGSVPGFKHKGKANVLWVDGHVSAESPDSELTKSNKLWDRD